MTLRDKVIGMFLGIGIGDALGAPVETYNRKQIAALGPIRKYIQAPSDHKWHANLPPGTTTDDTQLTLAVARAIIAAGGKLNMDMIANEHVKALNVTAMGWGPSTREAVERLSQGGHWSMSGKTFSDKPRGLGNGVMMKASPIAAMICGGDVEAEVSIVEKLPDFTFMTHRSGAALSSCSAHVIGLQYLLQNSGKEFDAYDFHNRVVVVADSARIYRYEPDQEQLIEALSELWPENNQFPDELLEGKESFAVKVTMPQAYSYFLRDRNSIDALYRVIESGGDTDSTGSVVASMLGALHGPSIFPQHLVDGLQGREEILAVANEFCDCLGI